MTISLLPLAQAELDDAFSWYEEQAIGLGYEFLDEFDQSIRLIRSYPELSATMLPDVRRCLMNRFPYGIIYSVSDDGLLVLAVAHLRKRPGYWQERVQEEVVHYG